MTLRATTLAIAFAFASLPATASYSLSVEAINTSVEQCFVATESSAQASTRHCDRVIRARLASKHNKVVALHNRGVVHLNRGDTSLALKDFRRAAKLAPTQLESILAAAQIHYQQHDYVQAKALFEQVQTLDAKNPTLLKYLDKQTLAKLDATAQKKHKTKSE